MQSEVAYASHCNLLQALPLIPKKLTPGRPPLMDEASSALLIGSEAKAVEAPSGAFAGLPAEIWSIIFEKLCPLSTSFIVSPSVIARDISHASLACRKFYLTAPIAWRSLENLIRVEDGKSRATNWTATRELEELELKRLASSYAGRSASIGYKGLCFVSLLTMTAGIEGSVAVSLTQV